MAPVSQQNKLITAPSLFIVGKTTFDKDGLNEWAKHRGFPDKDNYLQSPIKNLIEGAGITEPDQDETELMPELGGRFCYNSMMKGRDSETYITNILEQGHGSVTEHATYNIIIEGVSRSLSMELIRHRAGFAISQESQRFVNADEINFVVPPMLYHLWQSDLECEEAIQFRNHSLDALEEYRFIADYVNTALDHVTDPVMKTMIRKRANEAARAVLPNCAETRLLWTGNLRALRHFCELRGSKHADLEIRRLAVALTETFIDRAPFTFGDFVTVDGDFGVPFTTCTHHKV